ncbi:hypothetical protein LOTGIDRAFT_237889 [Lottia gigantea]|uniref:Uncharacterized protein n=1 Tax=Lottia gigantea TaxID=225164 RepID=V4B569_LOTGI|nr:hypothetical protein LOTGIDRAFT_237889 [Lottia gigantea]ESP02661.1 hypothetical protein LOTGIDRAFT_237889 [Lottia gigantea]
MATATRRIDVLAKPKSVHPEHSDDRRSVYWIDRKPIQPGPGGTTKIVITGRVEELSKSKDVNKEYVYHRPTPIWEVKPGALKATASGRVEQLSLHKTYNRHQMERPPHTTVTEAAKSANITDRLENLAKPKNRIDRFEVNEKEWGETQPVSEAAKKARITERVESLAEPKQPHSQFQPAKPIMWEVSDLAIKALASLRLQQLSRPRSRTMIKDDYDPYVVSRAARKAKATGRVEELSEPIERKKRDKKV